MQLRSPDSFENGCPAGDYFGGWIGFRQRLQKNIDFIKKIDTIKTTNRKQAADFNGLDAVLDSALFSIAVKIVRKSGKERE